MKQKLKALASLCLALALTLCLTLPAWAAGGERLAEDSTGAVTIEGLPETSTENLKVTAYKIMSVNWHNDGKEPLYEAPEDPTYKWEESVAAWLGTMTQQESNYSAYKDESGNVTDAFEGIRADPAEKFYTDLAKEIKKEQTSINVTKSSLTVSAAAGNDGTFTASGELAMGGYLVLVEGGTKIYSPVFLTVMPTYNDETDSWEMPDDTKPATAVVKQQELTFEKKIVKTTTDSGETLLDKDTVAINDSVTFRLTADVPKYLENAAVKTFKISDNLPEGMTLGDNPDFTVKGYTDGDNAGAVLGKGTAYTVATSPDTNMDFTLEFTYDQIKTYSKITVEYSVTMNKNTVVFDGDNANGTENSAVLTYVKDQLTGTTETLKDEAIVYSYGIQVTKKGESSGEGQGEPLLTDAVFTLKRAGENENAISFVSDDNGSYRVADSTETGATELTVGESEPMKGILKLSGLDVGEYLLTEVQAPAGYNKLSAPISINIQDDTAGTDSGPDGKPEYTDSENSTEVEAADGYVPVTVINTQGFTLPTTGGMGTVLFTAGGVVLMGAGLVLLVVFLRRRRAK
mgnify:FL=1